jgi:hypothetical protein
MHINYFPACPVDGPIEPLVYYKYSGTFVPNKCSTCKHFFEASCNRVFAAGGNHWMELDFGPCGIDGPTDPIKFEIDLFISKVTIPRKCRQCEYLKVDLSWGFQCRKTQFRGGTLRGLDWGSWIPDKAYLELPPGKNTSREMSESVHQNNWDLFLKEYQFYNSGLSIEEAKRDFQFLRNKLST